MKNVISERRQPVGRLNSIAHTKRTQKCRTCVLHDNQSLILFIYTTFSFCARISNSSAHQVAVRLTHPGKCLMWIQLIEAQTLGYFRKDQLAWPQGRRVQIDTGPLLLEHICLMETSPATRDRCWWSQLW